MQTNELAFFEPRRLTIGLRPPFDSGLIAGPRTRRVQLAHKMVSCRQLFNANGAMSVEPHFFSQTDYFAWPHTQGITVVATLLYVDRFVGGLVRPARAAQTLCS